MALLTGKNEKPRFLNSDDFYSRPWEGTTKQLEQLLRELISHKTSKDSDQVMFSLFFFVAGMGKRRNFLTLHALVSYWTYL
jgi:hypothetical protein